MRKKDGAEKSARAKDKAREAAAQKANKKQPQQNRKRRVAKTVLHTMPYECYVSNYVMLLKSNVRVGRETVNLYSKTYLVPDVNYSSLTKEQQLTKLQYYIDLLNGFDSTTSLQITMLNCQINKAEFEERLLLHDKDDGLDAERREINALLHDKIMHGQNGLQCRKFITVTVAAINLDSASTRFFNIEAHLISSLAQLGTEPIPLNANERVRLMADIFCDVNQDIYPVSREEFARQAEKQLCCPEYFEFKKDYFLFNEKFARCLYFYRLPSSIMDTIFKEILETNQSLIISKNIEFVEPMEALKIVQRKQSDMKQEVLVRTRKAAELSKGAFVDPIAGTQLAVDLAQAEDFLDDLQSRNQKMTLCQFIIMLTADSYEELQKNTEAIQIILRKYQVISCVRRRSQ